MEEEVKTLQDGSALKSSVLRHSSDLSSRPERSVVEGSAVSAIFGSDHPKKRPDPVVGSGLAHSIPSSP